MHHNIKVVGLIPWPEVITEDFAYCPCMCHSPIQSDYSQQWATDLCYCSKRWSAWNFCFSSTTISSKQKWTIRCQAKINNNKSDLQTSCFPFFHLDKLTGILSRRTEPKSQRSLYHRALRPCVLKWLEAEVQLCPLSSRSFHVCTLPSLRWSWSSPPLFREWTHSVSHTQRLAQALQHLQCLYLVFSTWWLVRDANISGQRFRKLEIRFRHAHEKNRSRWSPTSQACTHYNTYIMSKNTGACWDLTQSCHTTSQDLVSLVSRREEYLK